MWASKEQAPKGNMPGKFKKEQRPVPLGDLKWEKQEEVMEEEVREDWR